MFERNFSLFSFELTVSTYLATYFSFFDNRRNVIPMYVRLVLCYLRALKNDVHVHLLNSPYKEGHISLQKGYIFSLQSHTTQKHKIQVYKLP